MTKRVLHVFGRTSSSNTQKVLWFLHEVGLPFELTFASARLGPSSQYLCSHTGERPFGIVGTAEYAKLSPTSQIPVLQDGEVTVWESHSIVRYLASRYAPEFHLGSAEGMARCSPWMDWVLGAGFNLGCNHEFVDQMARTPPERRDKQAIVRAHRGYMHRLQLVERRLAETGAYLAGSRFTVADIPVGTELARWSCGFEGWAKWASSPGSLAPDVPEPPPMPHLDRYFRQLQGRAAFQKGCLAPEMEHHALGACADLPATFHWQKLGA